MTYYGVPPDVAEGLIRHPEDERDLPTVPLPRDFALWLYRDRAGLSWGALDAQPRWRTDRDLAYLRLEATARAWLDAERADADDRARRMREQREGRG